MLENNFLVVSAPGEDPNYLRRSPVELLIAAEADRPDAPLLAWPEGTASVTEFARLARRCAVDLSERFGVRAGDRVAVVGRNSLHRLAWQYGIYWVGAVEVSVNFELKESMLRHVLTDSDPMLILTDEDFRAQVRAQSQDVRIESITAPITPAADVDTDELDCAERQFGGEVLATILYTSGTTGPSKGVMLPRGYFANHAHSIRTMLDLTVGDVGYFVLPFFHVDAHIVFPAIIESGSSVFFTTRFSVRRFWSDIVDHGCTWAAAVGSILAAATSVEPPATSRIQLRTLLAAPVQPQTYAFYEDRLGIPILSMYGQTEADGVTHERSDIRRRGSAGVVCPAFDVAILGTDGRRLPAGQIGEICHRPRYPNMTLRGYWRRPDATVEAWQNLWYHTGDLGAFDADGFLFYKGRITDSLRRRGENISAHELEAVVRDAPDILDAAAVGVVDELGGEDEIKVLVACAEAHELNPREFFTFCENRLPRFAVPRFVEQVASTAFVRGPGTGTIQKHHLSKSTTSAGVYDRMNLAAVFER
ncbi:class I adenylate-forming enzyme family protein [Nocardia sp. NPDC060220]|uniref:class I adenylate-forming enzyme family protein n=1 Tax=Nocardia sp. NPDC060220 TaxID=3347076 RepID=UPI003667C166